MFRNFDMEDDNPLEFFGDDLIDPSPVKEKSKKPAEPPSLEVWICRQTRKTLVDWISKNKQEKIQKFIAYDWSNPSERVRQHYRNLVREAPLENSPISALCTNGDPSGGKLLNILITILENGDIGKCHFKSEIRSIHLLTLLQVIKTGNSSSH